MLVDRADSVTWVPMEFFEGVINGSDPWNDIARGSADCAHKLIALLPSKPEKYRGAILQKEKKRKIYG